MTYFLIPDGKNILTKFVEDQVKPVMTKVLINYMCKWGTPEWYSCELEWVEEYKLTIINKEISLQLMFKV